MIDVILSHLAAFALGGVVMAQLLQLNRRLRHPRGPFESDTSSAVQVMPRHPRGPIESDTSSAVQVMEHVRYHVAQARAWVSCLPSSPGYVVDLVNLFAGAEAILQRRINAQQHASQQHSPPSTTTTQERNAHN